MVTDKQVRRLIMEINKGKSMIVAACNADMSSKTARKYLKYRKFPSQLKKPHLWKTRLDPFKDVWEEIAELMQSSSDIQAKTIIEYLIDKYQDKFKIGQLRTLQRKMKIWKINNGIQKQVFFPQEHKPGILCESDFTNMNDIGISINGKLFKHMLYHFVLTYSNWETGNICYSESFESLSEGMQSAFWKLGKVPSEHRTDNLSSARINICKKDKKFNKNYQDLLNYYNIKGSHTQPRSPNENGDIEQRHYRLKQSIKQALILRCSNNFDSIEEYENFLCNMFDKLNKPREDKLVIEKDIMHSLPEKMLLNHKKMEVRVSKSSTIRLYNNTYSVNSSLIGEKVIVYVFSRILEVWYANNKLEVIPRLKGTEKHYINYRHIIDWLIRKPGAFDNYKFRDDLYPTTYFRITYDNFVKDKPANAVKDYLKLLYLAKYEGESTVNDILVYLINNNYLISYFVIEQLVKLKNELPKRTEVSIKDPDLSIYNSLIKTFIEQGETYDK